VLNHQTTFFCSCTLSLSFSHTHLAATKVVKGHELVGLWHTHSHSFSRSLSLFHTQTLSLFPSALFHTRTNSLSPPPSFTHAHLATTNIIKGLLNHGMHTHTLSLSHTLALSHTHTYLATTEVIKGQELVRPSIVAVQSGLLFEFVQEIHLGGWVWGYVCVCVHTRVRVHVCVCPRVCVKNIRVCVRVCMQAGRENGLLFIAKAKIVSQHAIIFLKNERPCMFWHWWVMSQVTCWWVMSQVTCVDRLRHAYGGGMDVYIYM